MEDTNLDIRRLEEDATSHCGTLSHNSESDSDSDVIYVERGEEVIELSDDEKNCSDIFKKYDVSDELVMALRQASNSISKKIRQHLKNKYLFREVMVEVPNSVWTLSWQVVSTIFKNPSVSLKESSKMKKGGKKRSGKAEEGSKKKRIRPDKPNVNLKEPVKIKEEKMDDTAEDDRVLSVIHFDPNKPPEFCEVSRSGRLIKKPCRLKDDVTFYKRRNRRRNQKKTNDSVLDVQDEISPQPQTPVPPLKPSDETHIISDESRESCNDDVSVSLDKPDDLLGSDSSLISDKLNSTHYPGNSRNLDSTSTSFEWDQISNESTSFCLNDIKTSTSHFATVVLEDSDESDVTFNSDNSSELNLNLGPGYFAKNPSLIHPVNQFLNTSKNKCVSKKFSDPEKHLTHNYLERCRRKDLQFQFHNLLCIISEFRDDFTDKIVSKVRILTESTAFIKHLESDLKVQMATIKEFEKRQQDLMKHIDSLYKLE